MQAQPGQYKVETLLWVGGDSRTEMRGLRFRTWRKEYLVNAHVRERVAGGKWWRSECSVDGERWDPANIGVERGLHKVEPTRGLSPTQR